jgi:hypothetical protein
VPDRERRLEELAVAVLTALCERDAALQDAERRAGEALQTMTDDEGLSVREAIEWCGRARHGAGGHPAAPPDESPARRRRMNARRVSAAGLAALPDSGEPAAVEWVRLNLVQVPGGVGCWWGGVQ